MLQRFYWWVGMIVCTRWWLRHRLKLSSAEDTAIGGSFGPSSRLPSVPPGPAIAVSVDYFGLLLATPRGDSYIILFIDRFSTRADISAVTAAKFTAEGTPDILINRCIPLWGCPRGILSGNGLQLRSKFSHASASFSVFEESPPAPPTRAVTVMFIESTTQWPRCWLWSSTSAKTIGIRNYLTWNSPTPIRPAPPLAWPPTRGWFPRLPLTTVDRSGVAGHQSSARDRLACCNLASELQLCANGIVR